MPNRFIHEMNQALRNADRQGNFYASRFDQYDLSRIQYNGTAINMFYCLKGFERYNSDDNDYAALSRVSAQLLSSAYARGHSIAYSIYCNSGKVSIYFGAHYNFAQEIATCLSRNLNHPDITGGFISSAQLAAVQSYNGFILGPASIGSGKIDLLIDTLQDKHCMVNILFVPVSGNEMQTELSRINQALQNLQRVSRNGYTVGDRQARRFEYDNQSANDTFNILNNAKKELTEGLTSALFRIALHVSAETERDYNNAAVQIMAVLGGSDNDISAKHYISVDRPFINDTYWMVPYGSVTDTSFGGLRADTLLNIAALNHAASVFSLPIKAHPGYHVSFFGSKASDDNPGYDEYPSTAAEGAVLGATDGGRPFRLSAADLQRHALLVGATQYGKSTTAKQILIDAHRHGTQFVAIEAAKKDYWELKALPEMCSVRVLSAGRDAEDLKINPFVPEEGTQLEKHIQSIIHSFLVYMTNEEGDAGAIRAILNSLVYSCYEKKGWDVSRRVRAFEELEYPTIRDMLDSYEECIDEIGYSEEIRNNMRGVFKIRLSALSRITSINTLENTSIKELYTSSAIIELEDLADNVKPFIAAILAVKVQEYTNRCRESHTISRLLLLEEAHHILPNPASPENGKFAADCSRYFSNMMAEASAYGTGIIVVDQRPSLITPSAIANAGLKIIHRLQQGDDIDTVQGALRLSQTQADILAGFRTGEAAVSLPGHNTVTRIRVNPLNCGRVNIASLFVSIHPDDSFTEITPAEANMIRTRGYSTASLHACITAIRSRSLRPVPRARIIALAGKLADYSDSGNPLIDRQTLYEYIRTI